MTEWVVTDFAKGKTGPQFQWLSDRLTLHGIPINDDLTTLRARVQAWQLKRGYTGTAYGQAADGFIGTKQLAQLKAAPPAPPQSSNIDLVPWKWTLPVGEEEDPDEVFPIGHFQVVPYFVQLSNGHIRARAHCGGVTTRGSDYARSEGREMSGTAKAGWDSGDGDNHLFWGQCAVLMLPPKKRIITFAQTHDALDDIVMLQARGFENSNFFDLWLSKSKGKDQGSELTRIAREIPFGEFFDWRLDFNESGISVMYNDLRLPTIPGRWTGCFNKWGTYVQANTDTDLASSYGETEWAAVGVSHG